MFEKFIPPELEDLICKKIHNMYMKELKKEIEIVPSFFWSHYLIKYMDDNMALYYDHSDFWDIVDEHYRSDIL